MDDLELFQQFRQTLAHCIVDNDRTKTAPDHQDDRFVCSKAAEIHGSDLISRQQLLTDGRNL